MPKEPIKFEEDFEIDPNQLDIEAMSQPCLFFAWAKRSADAREEYDRAKVNLELTEASLQEKVRKEPEKFDIPGKPTEAAYSAVVKQLDGYKEAQERLLQARKNQYIMDSAVNAMEQRKRMIELLVTLHGQSYFAGPKVPRNINDLYLEAKQRTKERVEGRQKARTRRAKGQ